MVDLFGPYLVKGEMQKRTSGKAYGVLFTDLYSKAVHIEVVFGYDTDSFLMALTRFASIRGWPEKIFSDPGTQLVGAEKELATAWKLLDKDTVYKMSVTKGTLWTFGPADSPWHQGAVETPVKAAKRCFKLSIGYQRLSPTGLGTLAAEVSNILNERSLGTLPSPDSEINILTPNSWLLGWSFSANPGGWTNYPNYKTQLGLISELANTF